MPEPPTIDGDVPCMECGYNLRTLSVKGLCPECGLEVMDSIVAASGTHDAASAAMQTYHRQQFEPLAASAGYPVDAFMFVKDAMGICRTSGVPAGDGRIHATARDVCRAVRDYATRYFNDRDEAINLLSEWGIRSSEDVGRIIFTFVGAGQLAAGPHDTLGDFDGLFVLDRLFDESVFF